MLLVLVGGEGGEGRVKAVGGNGLKVGRRGRKV